MTKLAEQLRDLARQLRQKHAELQKERFVKAAHALKAARGLKHLERMLQGGTTDGR